MIVVVIVVVRWTVLLENLLWFRLLSRAFTQLIFFVVGIDLRTLRLEFFLPMLLLVVVRVQVAVRAFGLVNGVVGGGCRRRDRCR